MNITKTEGIRDAEFLETEQADRLSRDQVTLTQDEAPYVAGEVLTETGGKMVRFDGTGTADGVLMLGVSAVEGDAQGTAIVRLAAVTKDRLVYADAVTPEQRETAVANLAVNDVIAR